MACHMLGMAEMAASIREQTPSRRIQNRREPRWRLIPTRSTALQVDERATMTPEQIVSRFAKVASPRPRRPPLGPRADPPPDHAATPTRRRPAGRVVDHRIPDRRDLDPRPLDAPYRHHPSHQPAELVLTADHDGAIVDDLVKEWAQRHGQPYALNLTGRRRRHLAGRRQRPELDPGRRRLLPGRLLPAWPSITLDELLNAEVPY